MKLGTETGSLVNHVYSRSTVGQPEPQIGMGATILGWTDRIAGTIVLVNDTSIMVQQDKATRTDKNGMSESQEYAYTPDICGPIYTFSKVTRGHAKGQYREGGRKDGRGIIIGVRRQYYDYSF